MARQNTILRWVTASTLFLSSGTVISRADGQAQPGKAQSQTSEKKKPESPDIVQISGILVDKKGAPLAGKCVAPMIKSQDGVWVFPLEITPDGRLEARSAKTDSRGRFTIRKERFSEYQVALCEGKGIETRLIRAIHTVHVDKSQKIVDVGKIVVE